jgi:N-carbamoylputrescine amidase
MESTMKRVHVAATQMRCSAEPDQNIVKAETLVREAAARGANIILIQELFESLYFCQVENSDYFRFARTLEENMAVRHFSAIAQELSVVLPISFFEKKNQAYYNSVAMIDADGSVMGIYRKTHIPDGPGYEEKYYFNPGDTGFRVWETRYANIGVGICWDQWFPETARCLVLGGAEILFYPTAIGTEPENPDYDSRDHWRVCMQGHSGSNMVPVVTSNRTGDETIEDSSLSFYGSSFITDNKGGLLSCMDRTEEGVIVAEIDLDKMAEERRAWGLFRDRRPDCYDTIMTSDGNL